MANDSKEHLLSEGQFSQRDSEEHERPGRKASSHLFGSRITEVLTLTLLFISICANGWLSSLYFSRLPAKTPEPLRTKIAGLEYNVIERPVGVESLYNEEPYSENDTRRDDAWLNMNVDRMVVVLDHEEARGLGLKLSSDYVWDDNKEYYGINAYHQLHCLQSLWKSVREDHKNLPRTQKYEHLTHCLDYLRQDVICVADDTLLNRHPTEYREPGEGQMRQCKDFSKLEEWARAPERNGCFVTYPKTKGDLIHQGFSQCLPGSPFMGKMKEYFGHGDDWVPDYEIHMDLDGPVVPWSEEM